MIMNTFGRRLSTLVAARGSSVLITRAAWATTVSTAAVVATLFARCSLFRFLSRHGQDVSIAAPLPLSLNSKPRAPRTSWWHSLRRNEMNKKYLLSSVTAGIALLYANHGTAQCVSTQDCTALGYTETSCPNGNGVKCPFGNKWSCPSTETAPTPEQCTELGFTQSCTGTGYVGGSGTACSGKYKACSCAEGYAWKDGTCKPIRAVCEVGMLYYSDDSCSDKLYLGKTVLGVVIYSNGASGGGWIMTVNPIDRAIEWGGYGTDISGLTNIISQFLPLQQGAAELFLTGKQRGAAYSRSSPEAAHRRFMAPGGSRRGPAAAPQARWALRCGHSCQPPWWRPRPRQRHWQSPR